MHVLCSTIESAKKLHAIGIQSGFRNSGFTVGKGGKITMAIRGTLSLEIPLSHNGCLLVSDEYLTYVTNICNEKMKENWNRTKRLFSNLQASVSQ
ncbi:tRNA wybutosine-synthesizing protein 3-like protein, partial [Stegodyphus mimosarum]